jgi:predicted PurR-regulated permease PerM
MPTPDSTGKTGAAAVRGRGKLAAVVFTVITLAVVSVPAIMITDSLLRTGAHLAGTLREEGGIRLPPPPEKVLSWPLIGEQAHAFWTLATQNLQQAIEMARPQVRRVLAFVGSRLAGAVVTVLLSLVAIVIAGFFLGVADRCSSTTRAIGKRIGGEPGLRAVNIAGATIRSMAQGVVGVALVQGTLAGIGLFLMGVPAAGLWALLVMILAVMQVPPLLVLGPTAIWAFSTAESTVTPIIFAV